MHEPNKKTILLNYDFTPAQKKLSAVPMIKHTKLVIILLLFLYIIIYDGLYYVPGVHIYNVRACHAYYMKRALVLYM